jgi:hypothetical protein
VVLLPSLGLLAQTLREWTFAATTPFEVLCVCSDQTVGSKGNDEAIHSVADLAFPVTSNAEEVKRFLSGAGNRVVFSTYQSSSVIAAAQADTSVPAFDLLVADEAHRCAGKVGSDFTTILDHTQIRSAKRLFATATPRTYSSTVHKAAEDRGVEVVGMDNAALFGEVLYALPFGKAIENKLLTDYRVVIIGVDDPTIAQWIANRELVSRPPGEGWGEGAFHNQKDQPSHTHETDSQSLAAQIGLLKAIKDYDLKRIISFHSRVNRAEAFTSDMQNTLQWISDEHRPSGTLRTDFVSGNMSASTRKRKLDQLKALSADERDENLNLPLSSASSPASGRGLRRGLLSNARCLSEGVDVPSLDGVAFIDPRSSQVDIIQAVGRAIRLSPDKKVGTIVLPVFIKAGEDAASTIEASNFKPIWDVLNALKAHDDVLEDELDQIRTEMGRKVGSAFDVRDLNKITIDLPATVDANFSSALRTYLVEQVTASWNFFFGLLEAYQEHEGNCFAPQLFKTKDGFRLGQWVAVQRTTRNNLSRERKSRLEALPGWSWNPHDFKWEAKFAELLAYRAAYGHVNVLTDPSNKVWVWVRKQRQSSVQGLLSEDRLKRLVDIGFDWDPRASNWDEMFNELLAYKAQYGDVNVPDEWPTPLGAWVGKQRNTKRTNILSPERPQKLNDIGFVWDANESRWEVRYGELCSYKEKHGDIDIPHDRTSELWRWVSTQRIFKKRGKLPTEKIRRLDEIGFVWDVAETQWEAKYNELIAYKNEHGHVNVRTQPPTPLGSWVNWQRMHYRKGKLSAEEIQRLNEIGFEWDPMKKRTRRFLT